MPFDGSGNYSRVYNWANDKANGVNITASRMDGEDNSIATAFNNTLTRDNQGKPSANFLPNVDNSYSLGSGSFRWTSINGVVNFAGSNAVSVAAATAAVTLTVAGAANQRAQIINGSSTSGQSFGLDIRAGTTTADIPLEVRNQAATTDFLYVQGDGQTFIQQPPAASAGTAGCFQAGYMDAPQNIQNAGYALVLTDRGKSVIKTGGVATSWAIPANASVAFPIGTTILLCLFPGVANITLSITSDTLYWATGAGSLTTGSRTLNGSGGTLATLYKMTATGWIISGTGIS